MKLYAVTYDQTANDTNNLQPRKWNSMTVVCLSSDVSLLLSVVVVVAIGGGGADDDVVVVELLEVTLNMSDVLYVIQCYIF